MKTLTKRKSLMGFIYALVMLLPFSAILVRCLYVTFNKNAYQSYSQTIATTTIELNANNIGAYYVDKQIVTIYKETQKSFGSRSGVYGATNFTFDPNELANTTNINYVGFEFYTSASAFWYLYDDLGNSHQVQKSVMPDIWSYQVDLSTYTRNSVFNFYNASVLVNTNGSLDNAFDYSLYTFLNENGSGRLNLTDWFTDLFLNRTTHNMLYLNYINWYMNYSLLVSCVYLLYSVLMWFLTFARYLINKPLKENE